VAAKGRSSSGGWLVNWVVNINFTIVVSVLTIEEQHNFSRNDKPVGC